MPSTRARSYLVIYGVVIRFWLACGRSPDGRISTFSWPSWTPRQKEGTAQGVLLGGGGAGAVTITTAAATACYCQQPRHCPTGTLFRPHMTLWGRDRGATLEAQVSDPGKERHRDRDSRASCPVQERSRGRELGWPGTPAPCEESLSRDNSPAAGSKNRRPIVRQDS